MEPLVADCAAVAVCQIQITDGIAHNQIICLLRVETVFYYEVLIQCTNTIVIWCRTSSRLMGQNKITSVAFQA